MHPHNGIYTQKYRNTSQPVIFPSRQVSTLALETIHNFSFMFFHYSFILSCHENYHSKRIIVVGKTKTKKYPTKHLHASIPITVKNMWKKIVWKMWNVRRKQQQQQQKKDTKIFRFSNDFQPRNSLRICSFFLHFSCCWLGFTDTLCVLTLFCSVVFTSRIIRIRKGVCVQYSQLLGTNIY